MCTLRYAPGVLFDCDACTLVVIDVQPCFLAKLPAEARDPLVTRITWLIHAARVLAIPILATVEGDDPVAPALLPALAAAGVTARDKRVFGLAGQDDLRAALAATGRRAHVLVGLETDVCVAHSALGLLAAGDRVAVIEDAVGSPSPHHERGLRRIAGAGAVVTDTKGIYYEWCRDVATEDRVRAAMAPAPPGVVL